MALTPTFAPDGDIVPQTQLVNLPQNGYIGPVATLDSFMSQWAASVTAFPQSLQGQDPIGQAFATAQSRCSNFMVDDCADINAIAQKWGSAVAAVLAAGPQPGYGGATAPNAPTNYYPPTQPPTTTVPTVPVYVPPVTTPAPTPAPVTPATPATPALPSLPSATAPAGSAISTGKTPTPQQPRILPVGALGGPVLFGISIVASILGALFGGLFGGGDVGKLTDAVNQLRSSLAQTAQALYRFAWTIAIGLGALLEAFHDFFVGWLDALRTLVKNILKALNTALTKLLPTVLSIIKKIRSVLDGIYTKYIRPALQWIQVLRKWLAIAKLLHIPFASKLDSILVQIQSKILAPFLYVLRTINGIGNWVNLIITIRGTIQHAVFLRTLVENSGATVNLLHNTQNYPATPTTSALTPGAPAPQSQAVVLADLNAYATTGVSPSSASIDPALQSLQLAAQTT
ncbi:MAG: hypothetical protein ACRDRL_22820 [Sciscionella sp.]